MDVKSRLLNHLSDSSLFIGFFFSWSFEIKFDLFEENRATEVCCYQSKFIFWMCETSVHVGFTSGFQSHSVTLCGERGAALAVSAAEGRPPRPCHRP